MISRYLVQWSGAAQKSPDGRPQKMAPVFFTCYVHELLARGFSLLWRRALFEYPSALLMVEWKLWRTDASILSASVDIMTEQAKRRTPMQAVPGVGLAGHSRPSIGYSLSSTQPLAHSSTGLSSNGHLAIQAASGHLNLSIESIHILIYRLLPVSQIPGHSKSATKVLLEIGISDPVRLIRALGFAAK